MSSMRINLELCHIPILDFCIWWVVGPANVDTFDWQHILAFTNILNNGKHTVVKQLRWLIPLVWLELPRLARCHNTDDAFP